MGYYKTRKCFFTGQDVISCDENNGECLNGYYYTILYNGRIREIRLYNNHDWANDDWIKDYGSSFIEFLDKTERWKEFEEALKLEEIRCIYSQMFMFLGIKLSQDAL